MGLLGIIIGLLATASVVVLVLVRIHGASIEQEWQRPLTRWEREHREWDRPGSRARRRPYDIERDEVDG